MSNAIKTKAKRLRTLLTERGVHLTHQQVLQLYARTEGHPSWEQWKAELEKPTLPQTPSQGWPCYVAASNANGEPDFCLVRVAGSEEDLDTGRVANAARSYAEDQGYEPELVYEPYSAGTPALKLPKWASSWEEVPLVDLGGSR